MRDAHIKEATGQIATMSVEDTREIRRQRRQFLANVSKANLNRLVQPLICDRTARICARNLLKQFRRANVDFAWIPEECKC